MFLHPSKDNKRISLATTWATSCTPVPYRKYMYNEPFIKKVGKRLLG